MNSLGRWAPLPLRLIVGYGFIDHGMSKLLRGPEQFAAVVHDMGLPMANVLSWATITVEVLGGLAILLGIFVLLSSIPMAIVLLVATFTVHFPYGFKSIKLIAVTAAGAQFGPPGYETDLLYLACLIALILSAPDPLALEGYVRKRNAEPS